MPFLAIPFPFTDPNAPFVFPPFAVGPLTIAIRWYAIAYIAGLLIGWRYCLHLADRPPQRVARSEIDDFLTWATLGVVLGGRIGYVLFYNLEQYARHPLEALYLWHGGMSFHGGALGVTIAILLFTWARNIPIFVFSDIICAAIPIGLFFGRIANFINGELFGRPAPEWASAIAMVYPTDPLRLLRYPSEIFEATLEGLCLFILLFVAERQGARRRPGLLSGLFLAGYAVARFIGECFRQPDPQRGYLTCQILCTTEGQLLSVPVLIIGAFIISWAMRAPLSKPR